MLFVRGQSSTLTSTELLLLVLLCYQMDTNETQSYEPSHFCGNFACLGGPWCTEWESCNFCIEVEKPVQAKGLAKNETNETEAQV